MFEYLSGTVDAVTESSVIIDVHGIGFEIQADAFTRAAASPGEKMRCFTQLRISDDRMILYGFQSRKQKDLFLKLTSVSGVGPKMALAILSGITTDDLVSAVVTEDAQVLQSISGVGKKIAQRLVLELRGKVDFDAETERVLTAPSGNARSSADAAAEAAEALEGLGYSHQEALKAVAAVRNFGDTAEDFVRLALKRFGIKG